jgi:hypothetical protein
MAGMLRLVYPGSMDKDILPSPVSGRILLLVSPTSTLDAIFEMVARLALQGPLSVLDGGNIFQGYTLARALRRHTDDIAAPMRRVMLSRAFTCYQVAAMLAESDFTAHPVLILDFLATFYDQSVNIADRRRLLSGSIRRLRAVSQHTPLVIWVRQRSAIPQEALPFLDVLQAAAGQVWVPPRMPSLPVPRQPPLFEDPD